LAATPLQPFTSFEMREWSFLPTAGTLPSFPRSSLFFPIFPPFVFCIQVVLFQISPGQPPPPFPFEASSPLDRKVFPKVRFPLSVVLFFLFRVSVPFLSLPSLWFSSILLFSPFPYNVGASSAKPEAQGLGEYVSVDFFFLGPRLVSSPPPQPPLSLNWKLLLSLSFHRKKKAARFPRFGGAFPSH